VGNNFLSVPYLQERSVYYSTRWLISNPQLNISNGFLPTSNFPLLGENIFEKKRHLGEILHKWETLSRLLQVHYFYTALQFKEKKWQLKRRKRCWKKGNNAKIILSLDIYCIVDKLDSVRGAQEHRLEFRQSKGAFLDNGSCTGRLIE